MQTEGENTGKADEGLFHPQCASAAVSCWACPWRRLSRVDEQQSAADLLADTREARDAKDFDRAEELAREGEARFDDPVWPITLALILADKGKRTEALAVLAAPRAGGLPRVDQLMAEGYASQRGGDPWRALTAYGEVLVLQPDNAEAKDAVVAIMATLRAAHGAEAIAGANPQREADRAAALVRWGRTLQGADPATRYVATDKALALLDSLIAEARAAQPVDTALVRRLRIDRVVALRNRNRMSEVIAEVESLFPTEPPPTYVTEALADALLYERRPEEAVTAYEVVVKAEPHNLNAQYGRVFALVEAERLDDAVAAIDAIAAGQGTYQAYPGVPSAYLNLEKSYADMLAADVRLWANDVDEGYTRLEAMAHAAPANPLIRRSLVAAMRQRGWPRQAEEDAAIAATLRPGTLPTQIMQANTELSRYRLNQAQAAVDRLIATAPDDLSVQRLAEDVSAARGWLIEADMGPTWTRGGGDNGSGKEWTSSLRAGITVDRTAGPAADGADRLQRCPSDRRHRESQPRRCRHRLSSAAISPRRCMARRPGARCRAAVPGSHWTGRRAINSRLGWPARLSRSKHRCGLCSTGLPPTRLRRASNGVGMRQPQFQSGRTGSLIRMATTASPARSSVSSCCGLRRILISPAARGSGTRKTASRTAPISARNRSFPARSASPFARPRGGAMSRRSRTRSVWKSACRTRAIFRATASACSVTSSAGAPIRGGRFTIPRSSRTGSMTATPSAA